MPRSVAAHLGFPGKNFSKDIKKAPEKIRRQVEKNIIDLKRDLISFKSSIYLDECMKIWKPKRYYVPTKCDGLDLVELTCSGAMRVIAAYHPQKDRIWLLAATLTHDHERLTKQTDSAVVDLLAMSPSGPQSADPGP